LPPFDAAEKDAVQHVTETGMFVRCLGTRQLLESKRRSGRPQDQNDILFLEEKLGASGGVEPCIPDRPGSIDDCNV
jgi:hypothetical protein